MHFKSTGSGQPQITIPQIANCKVDIFENLIQQNKIADILSVLDNKIELNNKINAELENMAKTLYDYWFVQFDFPDENKRPYKSWFNRILKSIQSFVFSNLQQGGLKYA